MQGKQVLRLYIIAIFSSFVIHASHIRNALMQGIEQVMQLSQVWQVI